MICAEREKVILLTKNFNCSPKTQAALTPEVTLLQRRQLSVKHATLV